MSNQPTSETIARKRSALTPKSVAVIPLASLCVVALVLVSWIYSKVEAHDRTGMIVEHLAERGEECSAAIKNHAEQINEAKAERVYLKTKMEAVHDDVREIKQLLTKGQ